MATELKSPNELSVKVGVYLIISPTGGRYVGSSKRLDKRINRYKNYSCSRQSAIYASLKKHGFENHVIKILFYCGEKELLFWERVFGDIYLASANFKNGLNICLPGYDDVPAVRSIDFNKRVSEIQKKRFENPEERKKIGEKSKQAYKNPILRKRQSDKLKEIYKSPELRNKRSCLQKEYFKSAQAREKSRQKTIEYFIKNPDKKEIQLSGLKKYYEQNPNARREIQLERYKNNPSLSKEHSKKLTQFYINNPEARKIISGKTKIQLENNHPRARRVIDVETGEIFKSSIQSSERICVPKQTMRNWLIGVSNNPTSYKFL